MMKRLNLLLLFFTTAILFAFSQTTLTLDWEGGKLPDVNYKRGVAAPGMGGFFDSNKMREFINYQSSIGMGIFNGIRNIFKDPVTNEFYYENGEYKNQQIAKFTNIRKYTNNAGLEMISQVGGTPRNSNYEFDSTYYKVLPWGPSTDFAPIPAEGKSMQEYQRNFAEWAINADKAVGEDFHSIWIGTQEVTHTLGFPGGNANSTNENKKQNIIRWVDYWKPISDQLRAAGAKTGGVQLNSSTGFLYNPAVDYMVEKDLHMDFLTYQFYQWGDTADLLKAVEATKRYCKTYPGTKLIIDRGAYGKLLPDGVNAASSQAVIYLLTGELGLMNHAEYVYAYTLDCGVDLSDAVKGNFVWYTKEWLNRAGTTRCALSGLPKDVGGFAIRNGDKVSIALWNRSNSTQKLNITLDNIDVDNTALLMSKHRRGTQTISSSIYIDKENKIIKGIALEKFDVVLMDVISPLNTAIDDAFTESLSVYPNPCNDFIQISNIDNEIDIKVYNLQGTMCLKKNNLKNNAYINVAGLVKGTYILKITSDKDVQTKSFVKL